MAHGQARVAVASQPGKTKHFQTLLLSDTDIMLCDCPGLVFPSFVSNTADLIAAGVYPIAQMRHFWPVIKLICERIPREILQAQYGIKLQPGPCTPEHFLDTYCIARSLLAAASGVPDHQPASRTIIKDYADGKLLYCHPPPHSDKDQFYRETFKTALQNTERLRRKLGNAEALLLEKGGDDDDVAEADAATLMMTSPLDGFLADVLSDPEDDDNDDAAAGQKKHGKVGNRGRTPKQKWGKKDRKNRDKDPYGCHSASANGVGIVLNAGKYSAVGYTRPVSYPTVTSSR
jgi:large subunit GTPase 1